METGVTCFLALGLVIFFEFNKLILGFLLGMQMNILLPLSVPTEFFFLLTLVAIRSFQWSPNSSFNLLLKVNEIIEIVGTTL